MKDDPGDRPQQPKESQPLTDDSWDPEAHFDLLSRRGAKVNHFTIIRELGQGGMGDVFLARDTRLGRKVALKALRPKSLGSEDAVARFLKEARVTARFSHPNIVTIHDVFKWRGVLFVALEYLEGQTLRQRMEGQRSSPMEIARIGLAIAHALQEAHRHQLLHRDLKPENVIIPKDGRLRVLDFGLAKAVSAPMPEVGDVDSGFVSQRALPVFDGDASPGRHTGETREGFVRGTPNYMAPEQWLKMPLSAAADVWALGVVLYEMVQGELPFRAFGLKAYRKEVVHKKPTPLSRHDTPQELVEIIHKCLARFPDDRPDLDEVIDALERVLTPGTSSDPTDTNPFRGLLPFSERHARWFFGRQAEIEAFLERARAVSVLPVVGPSGVGKSSFIRAGIIPRLREQGRLIVLRMRPGSTPIRDLASTLLSAGSDQFRASLASSDGLDAVPVGSVTEGGVQHAIQQELQEAEIALGRELTAVPAAVGLKLSALAEDEQAAVLLFVDQLEELYTLVTDDETRRAFLEGICLAADDPHARVRVIFTLRADFLGRLVGGPATQDALSQITVMGCPEPEALQSILARSVQTAGYRYGDPGLVREMVNAVRKEQAALSLLQFTGQMLWDKRDRGRKLLTRAAYEEIGGVTGALARHADSVIDALPPAHLDSARQIFLRLVTPEGESKIVLKSKLREGLEEGAEAVIDRLIKERAILVRRARRGGHPSLHGEEAELELVHGSLTRNWGRLSRWLDESREEIAFLAQVEQAADLWEQRGQREEEVWRGAALTEASLQLGRIQGGVPEQVSRFLMAGESAERRRHTIRRWRWVTVVTAVIAVGLTTAWLANLLMGPGRLCSSADEQLSGVWDAETRSALDTAFHSVDRPHAADTWLRVEGVLDGYAADWVAGYTDACKDTHVRGEQSEQLLDQRMACLDHRRSEFGALVTLYGESMDARLLDRSIDASYDLSPLRSCAAVHNLAAVIPPPADSAQRQRVEELRKELNTVAVLDMTGRYKEGLPEASGIVARAAEVGYPPLQAEALFRLGSIQREDGSPAAAEATLLGAAQHAAASNDDELLVRVLTNLVWVVGVDQARYEGGVAYYEAANIVISGTPDRSLENAELLLSMGGIHYCQGMYDEALEYYKRAMELTEDTMAEGHPDMARCLNNIGEVYRVQGLYDEARPYPLVA